jgi:hypothetical protein
MEATKRIKKIINWLIYQEVAENERALSEMLGYTKSSFSQIVNGKVPLSEKFAKNLCGLDANLNSVWLLTGEGEMFSGDYPKGEKQAAVVGDNNNLNNVNTDAALLRALDEIGEQRKLTQAAQEQVTRLVDIISNITKQQ